MSNIELEMSRGVDAAGVAMQRTEADEMAVRQQETMRKSGLATNGPSTDQYDYSAAEITEDPEGGFNLPNIGQKGVYPAGRNLQTGEVIQVRNDPDGLGAEGVKRYAESYTNTEKGEPSDIFNATVPLYMEHLQNGGTMDDFPLPVSDAVKERTQEAVEGLAKLDATQANLARTEYQEVPEQLDQTESITREQYAENPAVMTATKILSEYIAPGLFAGDASDESKMIEKSIEELSAVKASFWKMADIIIDIESGNMPDEVRDAYITLLTEHAKIPDMDADVWQGVATGMLADVPLMAATGGASALVLKTIGKQAAVKMLIGKLMTSTVKKTVGTAAAIGGTTGGMEETFLSGGEELMNQQLSGESRDWERVFDQAWTGTKWGVVLGMGLGPLLSKPGVDGVRYMMRNASDMFAEAGVRTDMAAQRGYIGVSESETVYNGMTVPEARSDLGVRFADPSMNEFYSRLQEALIGENPMLGKKPQKASQLLKTLEGQTQKGQRFSGYEVQEAGVAAWLKSQGDGNVSRDMMEDFLYANSPRTNILISSMTDWEGPGSESFKGAANAPETLRRGAALNVFQDRFFDQETLMQPVDMTQANASSKRFGADVEQRMAALDKAEQLDASGLAFAEDVPLWSSKPTLDAKDYPNAEGHTQVLWQWADRMQKARVAGKPFNEAVPLPEPRSEEIVKVTDLRPNGAVTLTKDPYALTSAGAREATANMTNDQILEMIAVYDNAKQLAPPKYGKFTITGEASNSYQEIRITLPYDGVTNPDTIAMERFGSSYKDLTHGNKTRVDRTMEYAKAPEVTFRDANHMPLEHNRLSTVRTQEFYTPDKERVLAVNELQSDMAVAMRKVEKTAKGDAPLEDLNPDDPAQAFFADAGDAGKDLPKPSIQPTKGWMEQSVNRIFQVADKQGYKQVAFPVDPAMIKQIQGWTEEMADLDNAKSTIQFYETLAKYLKKEGKSGRTLAKTWGIESVEMGHVGAAPTGQYAPEKMLIIKFNSSKHKGARPIYGVAAVSGAEGATMLDEEKE